YFFFFSSRRRHTRSYGDWSSDVCSSDLFSPMSAMRFSPGIFTMKMIIYQGGTNSQSGLVLMEMIQAGANPKQMRDQMLQQMRSRSEERRVGKEGRTRWERREDREKGRIG